MTDGNSKKFIYSIFFGFFKSRKQPLTYKDEVHHIYLHYFPKWNKSFSLVLRKFYFKFQIITEINFSTNPFWGSLKNSVEFEILRKYI